MAEEVFYEFKELKGEGFNIQGGSNMTGTICV
jgi:hypothetical protein